MSVVTISIISITIAVTRSMFAMVQDESLWLIGITVHVLQGFLDGFHRVEAVMQNNEVDVS